MTHQQYFKLAIPLILSGLSIPLLGAVDTAVAGRLEHAAYIGGVAVGSLIFNNMYWLFGFLRVSTTGFTAQALGAKQDDQLAYACLRPMLIALLTGMVFIIVQKPILLASIQLIGGSELVLQQASIYFNIRIWGAPFALTQYIITGWLLGMSKVKWTLVSQLLVNVLNMLLSVGFALYLDLGVAGIAVATLVSEIFGVIVGFIIMRYSRKWSLEQLKLGKLFEPSHAKRMLVVNRDLFLRTVCLLTMTSLFMVQGARMDELTLAGNAILLQLHYLLAYVFSGLANASSILAGQALGAGSYRSYRRSYTLSAVWGTIFAVLLASILLGFPSGIISLFTANHEVQLVVREHMIWIALYS
ncbi:MATE family efflux transporter [Paenibacillus sanguinis]|uniref:MATE family efflux transporter n=1 Tax=Paenibacillus sanguinis TaxID=225906 RepID=UPI00036B5A88|nr:MATE family efflux transporter [Paenibacillus sanguinis]